jgi:GDP-L-fucose synthase
MVHVVEKNVNAPVNVGSGIGISIAEVANEISLAFGGLKIEWDKSKPSGDSTRVMNTERIESTGFLNEIDLKSGIASTVEWFRKNQNTKGRYNAFTEQI